MKIAFYMDEGLEQIVLTPETETEKQLLSKLHASDRELSVYRGTFYECRGGWMRHGLDNGMQSTMIVLRPKAPEPETVLGGRAEITLPPPNIVPLDYEPDNHQ